jgi:hypothetical protein
LIPSPRYQSVTYSGFGHPLYALALLPSVALVNHQHSWASPFKAFLLSSDRKYLPISPSAPAIRIKTPQDLYPSLQRFTPTQKAVLLLAPQSPQGGAYCSLGPSDLPDSPASWPTAKASPFCCSPLVLAQLNPLESSLPVPQGLSLQSARLLPLRVAGLLGLLRKLSPTTSLEHQHLTGYFFTSLRLVTLR